jgi:hypothetical protein
VAGGSIKEEEDFLQNFQIHAWKLLVCMNSSSIASLKNTVLFSNMLPGVDFLQKYSFNAVLPNFFYNT